MLDEARVSYVFLEEEQEKKQLRKLALYSLGVFTLFFFIFLTSCRHVRTGIVVVLNFDWSVT